MASNTAAAALKTDAPLDFNAFKETQAASMDISVTVRPIEPRGKLIGFATVNFGGVVNVPDFRVFNGENGLFVSNPSKPDNSSRSGFRDTAFLVGGDIKDRLNVAVREAYVAEVQKLQARAAAVATPDKPRMRDQLEKAGQEAAKHNAGRTAPDLGKEKPDRNDR